MYNKQAVIEKAKYFINKYYPNVEYAMITGSVLEAEFITLQSDMDIVLISKEFSGITSHVVVENSDKIDFTRLGYYQISTILIDSAYDHTCIILNMLCRGEILRDNQGVFAQIKDRAKTLLERGNLSSEIEFKKLQREMIKLKKNLSKTLNLQYNFFMLIDFAKLISSFHLFTISNGWYAIDGYRTVKEIYRKEQSMERINSIIQLVNEAQKNIRKYRPILISYIDWCITNPNSYRNENDRLIIDIQFRHPSKVHFYGKVCDSIINHTYLAKYFIYGQTNPYAYIFHNKYVLIFDKQKKDFNEITVLKELYELFDKNRIKITQVNSVNPEYLNYFVKDKNIYSSLENILSQISTFSQILTENKKKFQPQKSIMICFILGVILAKELSLSKADIKRITQYLFFNWRPSSIISNIDYKLVNRGNKLFIQNAALYYIINKAIYKNVYLQINATDFFELDNIDIQKVIYLFKELAININNSILQIDLLFQKQIMSPVDFLKMRKYYYYSVALDMLTNVVGIEKEEKSKLAYTIRRVW